MRQPPVAPAGGNKPYGQGPGFQNAGAGPAFGPGNMGQGSDLPVGLGMRLKEEPLAMERFTAMAEKEKWKILKYVESGTDGEDARRRIEHTIKSLREGTPLKN